MNKLPGHLDDLLVDYLDGNVTPQQRSNIESLLNNDAQVRARFDSLKSAHEALANQEIITPSTDFTQRVMHRINHPVPSATPSIRNGLLLLAGIVVVLSIAVLLLSAGVFDGSATVDLNDMSLVQKYINRNAPRFSFDGKTLVNAIVLFNLVLAFVVLDRAVLKPLFERRMQSGH